MNEFVYIHGANGPELVRVAAERGIVRAERRKRSQWLYKARCREGRVTSAMRADIYNRDGHRCVLCGSDQELVMDHIVPICRGGVSTAENLRTLCRKCNLSKVPSDRLSKDEFEAWFEQRGN